MGNFCPNCGRPLNEGEVCDCTQKSNVREDETDMQKKSELKNNLQYRIKEGVVPKLLVPIGQTVIGGILVLFALICGGVDWG